MPEVILELQNNRYYLTKQVLPLRQKSLVSASVLYAYFCFMDVVRFPSELYIITIPVRLVFFLIPLVILATVYYRKEPDNQSVHFFWLTYLYVAAGLIHSFLVYWVTKYNIPFPDSGFILIILYGCLLMALPIKAGAIASAIIMAGFICSMYFSNYDAIEVVFNSVVYTFFCILCLAVNRVCQAVLRQNFVLIKRLYNESIFDELTQLYNRRHFDQQLELLLQIGHRDQRDVGLVFLDVDHFKQFNDSQGHLKADNVLRKISSSLKEVSRRNSDFAARYGGDEFVLVFYDIDERALEIKCKAIIDMVRKLEIKYRSRGVSKLVTVSLGAALLRSSNKHTIAGAIESADKNLYKAKERGRDCFVLGAT
jgi:diguanylate cyclase